MERVLVRLTSLYMTYKWCARLSGSDESRMNLVMLMSITDTQINLCSMVVCVHIKIIRNIRLLLVKVLDKIPPSKCFFFRNQKSSLTAVSF